MQIRFQFTSLQTGETVAGYLDANEVLSWIVWNIGDDVGPNMHRKLRGKTLVTIATKSGSMNWTEESFDEVSHKILHALGQADEAKVHKELADGARVSHSPFAV